MLDPTYRTALQLPGERLLVQRLEAEQLPLMLAAVGRLLMPAAGALCARLYALNVYREGERRVGVSVEGWGRRW